MAVYWMAIEAKASSSTDFQEHCMVVRTGGAPRRPRRGLQNKGSNTRRDSGQCGTEQRAARFRLSQN